MKLIPKYQYSGVIEQDAIKNYKPTVKFPIAKRNPIIYPSPTYISSAAPENLQNIYNKEASITGSRSVTGHANVTCSVIETGDCEVAKYLLGILHSRVVAFYMFKCVYCSSFISTHLDKPYKRKLIVPSYDETIFNEIVKLVTDIENTEYLSDDWFEILAEIDAYVYYAFDISNEDVLYIESELQKFRSKRWR